MTFLPVHFLMPTENTRTLSVLTPKLDSGQLVVAGILLVAVAAGGISVWHQWNQGRQAISYFGTQAAYQIRHASHVEWNKITADAGEGAARDISQIAGLVHFRQALIEDDSYEGQVKIEEAAPNWQYTVSFRESGDAAATLVLLDVENGWVGLPHRDTVLAAGPIAPGIRRFFADIEPSAR